ADDLHQEDLKRIFDTCLRARDIVHKLLSFGHHREGAFQAVKLADTCREALSMVKELMPDHLQLHVALHAQTALVMADTSQIHQVIVNLCNNAIKSLGDRHGNIHIHLEQLTPDHPEMMRAPQLPQDGPHMLLSVSDDGPGILEEHLERVFDPFFTTRPMNEGAGLGLSVVYGIVRHHQGIITVENRNTGGARVNVWLPVAEQNRHGLSAVDTVHQEPRRGAGHLLVVDDDPLISTVICQLLIKAGFSIEAETDPEQALARFQAQPDRYHLLITDLGMPNISGRELVDRIRAIRPDIPVLICTGYGSEQIHLLPDNAKVITKPVLDSELIAHVMELLHNAV
ncbi:MAG: response regulator, partial [Magnetococcales bacterium]|nr:response regulator [Magnetococcales bacterium]